MDDGATCAATLRKSDLTLLRKIRKSSVNKATELITKHKGEKRRRSSNTETVLRHSRIVQRCKSLEDKRKRVSTVGFSKSVALSEMQSYIARQDWKHALHLLSNLLEYPVELEPLVWRCLFIILLHVNDSLQLCKFLERCVGSRSLNNNVLLERLLLLASEENF